MKSYVLTFVFSVALAVGLNGAGTSAQSATDTVGAHVAAAKGAAGQDHLGLVNTLCAENVIRPAPAGGRGAGGGGAPAGPPDRAQWHAEPAKVFDNLYFVGMTEYSSWAITTSQGIIILDTIFDYSVEDEIVGGLRKLGLDPTQIKYAIVSHAHTDHAGGAKYLQDHFGARVMLSAADWDMLDRTNPPWKPKRDLVATDGQKLTLGDTTLTLYVTPGHTPGTISTLIPVKDGGTSHLVAEWGGTLFNFARTPENFDIYISSAERFRGIVAKANADVAISNHTIYDGSKMKLPALAKRKAGDQHPYVIGNRAVQNYLTVAGEYAKAALTALNQ